jgi:3-hydroxyisobutyrate dehydrogenase-like beta-hydroxyacid dehydrogenase
VGGEPSVVDKVIPIIESYSENVIRTGPLGSGMTGKIINTFVSMANCAVIAEAVATGVRVGIDFEVFYQIVSSSGADSRMFQQMMPWVLKGDTSRLKGHLKTAYKDVTYYSKLADSVNATTFVGASVEQLFRHAVVSGHGDSYTPVLSGIAARINGDEIRPIEKASLTD